MYGMELWKSDGTAAGAGMLKDINPETAPSMPRDVSSRFTSMNSPLFLVTDVV